MTVELYHIACAISKGRSWQSIFNEHCQRTGKSGILPGQIVVKYDAGDHGFEHEQEVTWRKHTYKSNAYPTSFEANNGLYRKLVESVMTKEINKAGVLAAKANGAAEHLADD